MGRPRGDASFALALATVVLLPAGAALAGVGTDAWVNGPVVRVDGAVVGREQAPAGFLDVQCVTRLAVQCGASPPGAAAAAAAAALRTCPGPLPRAVSAALWRAVGAADPAWVWAQAARPRHGGRAVRRGVRACAFLSLSTKAA